MLKNMKDFAMNDEVLFSTLYHKDMGK